jgi:2-dehydropantoate 2-reductase
MLNGMEPNRKTQNHIRVLIYGGGAVGLGVASCLLHSGHEVDILARPETVAALESGGLIRRGFRPGHAKPGTFRCYKSLDEACSGPYDFILICTKSYDSPAVARELGGQRTCTDSTAKLVLFQNGWGNAEVFAGRFDKSRIFNARVITGFHKHRPSNQITVHADTSAGSLFQRDASASRASVRSVESPCETARPSAKTSGRRCCTTA